MTTDKMSSKVQISERTIGVDNEPYVIAEMSANHCGQLSIAHEIVEAASFAGANAIKLQHYKPESMTIDSDSPEYQIRGGTLWDGKTLFDLYGEAMMPWEWTDELITHANNLGLHCFSSPFDREAVDYLITRNVPAIKIASFEIVDLPLIHYAASKMRPMILSTGLASEQEIDDAVKIVRQTGNTDIVVLRCNSSYPARNQDMNLVLIDEIVNRWDVVAGLSDHTKDNVCALVSLGLGASVFEKHLTNSRATDSVDAPFSLEPDEFKTYVDALRSGFEALGRRSFGPSAQEMPSLAFRRSLRATSAIPAGQRLSSSNVASLRPAGGLSPKTLFEIDRYVALRQIKRGEAITSENARFTE